MLRTSSEDNAEALTESAWLVRVGCLGDIFLAQWGEGLSAVRMGRSTRLLVRTSRGVELAEVIQSCSVARKHNIPPIKIIRATTDRDEALIQQLDRNKHKAVEACRQALLKAEIDVVLLDVDQLFDDATLIFHFLGPTPPAVDQITKQIVSEYESNINPDSRLDLLDTCCDSKSDKKQSFGCSGQCGMCSICPIN